MSLEGGREGGRGGEGGSEGMEGGIAIQLEVRLGPHCSD